MAQCNLKTAMHLPLDWERSAELRLLAMKLRNHARFVPLWYVRLWTEWGTVGDEWRPLKFFYSGKDHEWQNEDVTYLIEQFVEWSGSAGEFVAACIESGVLLVEQRGDLSGLVLTGFWKLNCHLSPDYKSIQQLGGIAKAQRKQQEEVKAMAAQQLRIIEAKPRDEQAAFWMPRAEVTREEREACLALVMRLDRACGRSVRRSSEYDEGLLASALEVIRAFTPDDIDSVERYVFGNRDNPAVVKEPDRILLRFAHLLEAAA